MYHRVANALVLDTGSGSTAIEFTRAIELGEDNSVLFEAWVVSATGTIDDITITLQGSNDLSNWSDFGTNQIVFGLGGPSVTVPDYAAEDVGVTAWSFVRLKFVSTSSGSKDCMVRGSINTTRRD